MSVSRSVLFCLLLAGCDLQQPSRPATRPVATPTVSEVEAWHAETFQDVAIDPSNRTAEVQQNRRVFIEPIFGKITPPENNVVTAELLPQAREGWYSDDVARKNFAGIVYALNFGDDSGTVNIVDGAKQVGTYRWSNGPVYSDVAANEPTPEFPKLEAPKPQHQTRTWTSTDGHTVEAQFVWHTNGTVALKRADGTVIKVPLEKFSEPDRQYARTGRPPQKRVDGLPATGKVVAVVDGDTIRLQSGERVRLIGVDTPETVHPSKPVQAFGKEASAYTRRHLEGESVRLTYDQANAATKHRDKYRRLLAYVVRERDNFDINAELIRQGYAHAYTQYPLSRNDEFLGYQREAREQGRGLWAPALPTARGPPADEIKSEVYVTRTGAKYHRSGCRYLSKSKIPISLEDAKRRYSPCSVCNPP